MKIARYSQYLSYFFHSLKIKNWKLAYFGGERSKIWLDLPDLAKIRLDSSSSAYAESYSGPSGVAATGSSAPIMSLQRAMDPGD